MTEAYPLQWPVGRPRTASPRRSAFAVKSFEGVRVELFRELNLLAAKNIVLSTNLRLRGDGFPYSKQATPADKGIAVYFELKKRPMCFACDKWDRVEDNLRAIAKTIEAIRGIERWGGGDMVEQAFTGFTALPAPAKRRHWSEVLGVDAGVSGDYFDEVTTKYRRLARENHPDNGGNSDRMAEINAAYDEFKREKGL